MLSSPSPPDCRFHRGSIADEVPGRIQLMLQDDKLRFIHSGPLQNLLSVFLPAISCLLVAHDQVGSKPAISLSVTGGSSTFTIGDIFQVLIDQDLNIPLQDISLRKYILDWTFLLNLWAESRERKSGFVYLLCVYSYECRFCNIVWEARI